MLGLLQYLSKKNTVKIKQEYKHSCFSRKYLQLIFGICFFFFHFILFPIFISKNALIFVPNIRPVADLGFPIGGGANHKGAYFPISQKHCMKMKKKKKRTQGAVPGVSHGCANDPNSKPWQLFYFHIICDVNKLCNLDSLNITLCKLHPRLCISEGPFTLNDSDSNSQNFLWCLPIKAWSFLMVL